MLGAVIGFASGPGLRWYRRQMGRIVMTEADRGSEPYCLGATIVRPRWLLIALSIAVIHCVGLLVFAVKTAKKSV